MNRTIEWLFSIGFLLLVAFMVAFGTRSNETKKAQPYQLAYDYDSDRREIRLMAMDKVTNLTRDLTVRVWPDIKPFPLGSKRAVLNIRGPKHSHKRITISCRKEGWKMAVFRMSPSISKLYEKSGLSDEQLQSELDAIRALLKRRV